MKNLGKILFLILCTINLIASEVNISVSAPAIYKGENVSFTLTASSDNVKFPNISNIDNFPILSVSNSSSTSIINGSFSKKISKTYTFAPTKDVIIPSFNINVDGDTYQTKAKKVSVIKPSKSKNGDDFIVEVKLDKSSLRVGESTTLRVLFKQRLNAQADKLNLKEPKIENFWIEKIDNDKNYNSGEYIVREFSYLIFAQKSGNFHFDSLEADIGHIVRQNNRGGFFNDPFFSSMLNQLSWKKIYSNSLDIEVKALPDNLELYGDFKINAIVDKTTVYANKPLNLVVKVSGIGNMDDIEKFDINLPNSIVYADKPKVSTHLRNGEFAGSFSQKIAIIADRDYTIPSLKLTYFDKKTQKIKTIKTDPIKIKVEGSTTNNQEPIVQKLNNNKVNETMKNTVNTNNTYIIILSLILGIVIGAIFTYILMRKNSKKEIKKENNIVQMIKKSKSNKELFNILLPFAKDNIEISNILKLLEENIYNKANNQIDKQKLYDIFL